jgi:small ligand-binding sensory domain FIST
MTPLFAHAHATHHQWMMAAGLVLAQLRAQLMQPGYARQPCLALLYLTDSFAAQAKEILAYLSAELPQISDWSGTVGVGISANNVEYFDEPAMAIMLCDIAPDQYRVFSGVAPLSSHFAAHTALVHADARTPDLADLIDELAGRTATGYLFGGLTSSRNQSVQLAWGGDGFMRGQALSSGVFEGGLSGVAFGAGVKLISRVTQGCLPLGKAREVTDAERNVVYRLDGRPALEVLLEDLKVSLKHPQEALDAVRSTLVGLMWPDDSGLITDQPPPISRTGNFGADVLVRHLVGLDGERQGVAVAEQVQNGMQMAYCQRDVRAARADLVRICAEIREELEPETMPMETAVALGHQGADAAPHPARGIAGAVYISCAGRGGPHFGAPSAELQLVRQALGDVPLVGFFAAGEIARHHLYGYTGVLTVFTGE